MLTKKDWYAMEDKGDLLFFFYFLLVAEFELDNFSTKCDHCLLHFSILSAFLINTICHKF